MILQVCEANQISNNDLCKVLWKGGLNMRPNTSFQGYCDQCGRWRASPPRPVTQTRSETCFPPWNSFRQQAQKNRWNSDDFLNTMLECKLHHGERKIFSAWKHWLHVISNFSPNVGPRLTTSKRACVAGSSPGGGRASTGSPMITKAAYTNSARGDNSISSTSCANRHEFPPHHEFRRPPIFSTTR